jgi:hypothetical protein
MGLGLLVGTFGLRACVLGGKWQEEVSERSFGRWIRGLGGKEGGIVDTRLFGGEFRR